MLVLLWFACRPDPGEAGSYDCNPVPVAQNCSIWECWDMQDNGIVSYQYAWGWDDEAGDFARRTEECYSPGTCAEEAQYAANHACPASS